MATNICVKYTLALMGFEGCCSWEQRANTKSVSVKLSAGSGYQTDANSFLGILRVLL